MALFIFGFHPIVSQPRCYFQLYLVRWVQKILLIFYHHKTVFRLTVFYLCSLNPKNPFLAYKLVSLFLLHRQFLYAGLKHLFSYDDRNPTQKKIVPLIQNCGLLRTCVLVTCFPRRLTHLKLLAYSMIDRNSPTMNKPRIWFFSIIEYFPPISGSWILKEKNQGYPF